MSWRAGTRDGDKLAVLGVDATDFVAAIGWFVVKEY